MTTLSDALRRIVVALDDAGSNYALVGGLAVARWAEPRLTRDAAVVVSVSSDREAESLIRTLGSAGYRAVTLVEEQNVGRLATVRLADSSDVLTDLLFASSGVEPEIVEAAVVSEVVPGVVLPVACAGDLIAMKLLSRDDRHRPNDADDLRSLREVATETDWDRATAMVALIEKRGYARDRDLATALVTLRRDGAY